MVPMSRVKVVGVDDIGETNGFFLDFEFAGFASGTVAGGVTCFDVLVVRTEVERDHRYVIMNILLQEGKR